MPDGRARLLDLLSGHDTRFPEEAAMIARTRRFVAAMPCCFDRTCPGGHVTASAWVLNPAADHALMIHHRKLDLWLQPGGHADGDADLLGVAVRETVEEIGAPPDAVRPLSAAVFDVDVHTVPATGPDPRHDHFDIRFLVMLDDRVPLAGNPAEAHDVAWVPLRSVPRFSTLRSIYRMLRKTEALRRGRSIAA